MNSKKLFISYLAFLHIALAFVIFKTDFIPKLERKLGFLPEELTPFYHDMVSFHSSIDKKLPTDTTLFIGDSITQGLAVSAVITPSVNYGIGLDTSYGVLKRIGNYESLKTAKAIFLAIGYNDLKRRNNEEIIKNYQQILDLVPTQTQIIISAILPVDERINGVTGNSRIREINSALKTLSNPSSNIFFVDTTEKLLDSSHNLKADYHIGDGIHLSTSGYDIWIKALKMGVTSR